MFDRMYAHVLFYAHEFFEWLRGDEQSEEIDDATSGALVGVTVGLCAGAAFSAILGGWGIGASLIAGTFIMISAMEQGHHSEDD